LPPVGRADHRRQVLTDAQIERFVVDGYVAVRRAVATRVIRDCREVIWSQLEAKGIDRRDHTTWREPLVRLDCPEGGPFRRAGTSPRLLRAYDQLLGPGTYWPRPGVGGTIPVRFPSRRKPVDGVWHIDGSFATRREIRANIRTRDRGLLALFLFSRVTRQDAPTRLLVGSHHDVALVLRPARDRGMSFWKVMEELPRSTFRRPVAYATGDAGDVFVCHPFLVHSASWPHTGTRPRMVAQPAVAINAPLRLKRDHEVFPVEQAILEALGR
jgi:hypothetical protein